MIKSFGNKDSAALFAGLKVRRFGADWADSARRKLTQLNAAVEVETLRLPPGNRLEKLSGDRDGQWSLRINGQWRVCFRWHEGAAWDVEIADYH
jgi:toxin HigB-1